MQWTRISTGVLAEHERKLSLSQEGMFLILRRQVFPGEDQLRVIEKLHKAGKLAAGMAHFTSNQR